MLSPSFPWLFSIISRIPFAATNYTYGEEALYLFPVRWRYLHSEEALYLLPIRRGGYTYSEEALYLLHIRKGGYTYSEEALYLLPIRRGGYTYSEEALYLLPILRCASLSGLCGGAALMAVPLVRAGRSHALRLGTGTQNDRQSSTPCGNSTSCAKLYLHLLSLLFQRAST